jgi:hypothetical protein
MVETVPTPESSKVAEIGYDRGARELTVTLVDGERWVYVNVPVVEWERLLAAPSKGLYVNVGLKSRYRCRTARRAAAIYPGL